MTLDTLVIARNGGDLQFWCGDQGDGDGNPVVVKNVTNATVIDRSITFDPGQLAQHPGPGGEYSVVRFTAPTTGTFTLDFGFVGMDNTTTDAHILVNGVSLADGYVNGFVGSSA